MKAHFDNSVVSSFLMYIDNKILVDGEAYTNLSGYLYPTATIYSGVYSYGLPYNQVVADRSVTGATYFYNALYLDGTLTGASGIPGFIALDVWNGRLHVSGQLTGTNRISGLYAVKDYNVVLTSEPEEKLLFETKYSHKSKYLQTPTGLKQDELTFPAVFIRLNSKENDPFAFGGTDESKYYLRCLIFSDSQYKSDAVAGILTDLNRTNFGIFPQTDTPYGIYNNVKADKFDYTGFINPYISSGNYGYIERCSSIQFNANQFSEEIRALNPQVYTAIVDFTCSVVREPRG